MILSISTLDSWSQCLKIVEQVGADPAAAVTEPTRAESRGT
jgi:hypothetical protein